MLQSYVDMIMQLVIWEPHEVVLVAVSGGPDSVCLMRLMDMVAKKAGFFLHIAHLDHQFRGIASQGDAIFVEQLAQKLGWPVTVQAIDVPSLIEKTGQSMQDCSRMVRYGFLREVAEAQGINKIILGHNKDDQAETILQHLIRGTGMSGMRGMDIITKDKDGIRLIRPLLDINRTQIMQILEQLKQPFRIDASNQGDKYQRNHIRHHLIPYLQTHYNPAIINRLTEMAKVIQQEHAYLVQLTEKWMLQAVYQEDGRVILNCNVASNLHPAIQVRMCREMYRMVTGHTQNLSYNHSLEMQKMIEAPHGKRVSLPGNVCCEKIYSKLHVYLELQKDKAPSFFCQVKLNAETCLPDGSRLFTKIISLDQVTFPLQDNTLVLDLNEVGYDLFVRYRHNGDVFKGLGAKGHKKLKDFFIDQKIPHYKRDHIPLLVNASDQILWIIPYRSSEYGKLTAQSERVLWCYHAGGTNNA